MKKETLVAVLLIFLFGLFSSFIYYIHKEHEVLEVITPTKLGIDLNNIKIIDECEVVCLEKVESFSLEPTQNFIDKYSEKLNLNYIDFIDMGYLAQEFSEKQILNQNVKLKYTNKITPECIYAKIFIK